MIGTLMLTAGVLMAAALAASLLARRLRLPGLLLFLAIGMVIGSDGVNWLHFDDYNLARDLGIVALVLILFEGGLTTRIEQLRPVAGSAISLSLLGTFLTAMVTGVAAAWLFSLPLLAGLLLGSIVASTDVAAIFALLRGSGLQPRLTRLLEGEAGSNDPVAILLVVGFIEWIGRPDYGIADMSVLFARQVLIGIAVGLFVGWLFVRVMRSIELPTVGLHPVASLTVCAVAFGAADVLGGSGFLSVYLAGLALASAPIPAKRTITAFHDGLAWLAQLGVFLTLGLLVFPSQLPSIAVEGTVLALILVFVARPLASVAATAFASLTVAERVVLAWAGLRGAVPIVLATFPVIAGVPDSLEFFNIVFFAVVLSLIVQSPTFEPLARRLGLVTPTAEVSDPIIEVGAIRRLGAEVVEVAVEPDHAVVGTRIRDVGLPREAVVNVIVRDNEAIPPRGSTRIQAGDRLYVIVRREVAREVADLMERWANGPIGTASRPRRRMTGSSPIFTVRPCDDSAIEGPVATPTGVLGEPVVARLRVRRDRPGALVALEDGRYAVTGDLLIVGSRDDISAYLRRRIREVDDDQRAWFQTAVAALALDSFEPWGPPRGTDVRGR